MFTVDIFCFPCNELFTFHVSIIIPNRLDSFVWQLVVIYGTAYADQKMDFITELHDIMDNNSLPILFGGDFNLVRNAKEKSNANVNAQWVFLFNDWVNKWNLVELKTANRLFTWTNNQAAPIFATLDRVFASTTWEQKFPMSTVRDLSRVVSDHTPLLLDTGHNIPHSPKIYRFEKWWINQDGFSELVRKVCNLNSAYLGKKTKVWSINLEAALKNKKRALMQDFDILDVFSEQNHLDDVDRCRMEDIKTELDGIWLQEETKAWQRLESGIFSREIAILRIFIFFLSINGVT
jgi:hypothetical protein